MRLRIFFTIVVGIFLFVFLLATPGWCPTPSRFYVPIGVKALNEAEELMPKKSTFTKEVVAIMIDEKPVEFSSLEEFLENLVVEFKEYHGRPGGYYEFGLKNVPPSWKIEKAWFKAIPVSWSDEKWADCHPYWTYGMYGEGRILEAIVALTNVVSTKKSFQIKKYLPDGSQVSQEVKLPITIRAVSYGNLSETELNRFSELIRKATEHRTPLIFEFDFYHIWPKPEKISAIQLEGITIDFFITGVKSVEKK